MFYNTLNYVYLNNIFGFFKFFEVFVTFYEKSPVQRSYEPPNLCKFPFLVLINFILYCRKIKNI